MGLTCRTSIAGTRFQFDDFGWSGFWNLWQWKLDPYRIYEDASGQPDVVIRNADRHQMGGVVLSSQRTGFFRREVLRAADGGTVWRFVRSQTDETCVSYHVSPDFRQITLAADNSDTAGVLAFEYLGQLFPHVQLKQGVLTFHGALLEYEGQAFAICAPSGTGKTTHARLWRDCRNALILNGDRAVLRRENEKWMAWGTPWCGTSGEQINRRAPLKAMVLLERGSENRVQRLKLHEIFRALFPHLLYPVWNRELTWMAFDLLDDLLRQIPVYRLECRPDADAVETLRREIYDEN